MKNIKIAYLPGRILVIGINDGETVADAIKKAGLSSDGLVIKRNGENCREDDILEDGDTIFLIKRKIEGNKKK